MKNFFKKYFFAGLITLLPIVGTLWLLKVIIFTAEDMFQSFLPKRFQPNTLIGHDIPGVGLFVAFVTILLIGLLTRLYLGKKILNYGDQLFSRIPLGRSIYSAIKQFLSMITGDGQKSFRRVALVPYPKQGSYALGFVTGIASGEIQEKTKEKMINVFIPTTPNPTSGFLVMYPEHELTYLDMSVETAFKLIISGGVVVKN